MSKPTDSVPPPKSAPAKPKPAKKRKAKSKPRLRRHKPDKNADLVSRLISKLRNQVRKWHDGDDPRVAEKTDRILWIMDAMGRGAWVPALGHVEAAQHFEVSIRTIEEDAAEAGRFLQLLNISDETLKTIGYSALHRAMKMAEEAGGAQGAAALTNAVKTLFALKGIGAPQKVEHRGMVSIQDFLAIGKPVDGENDDEDKEPGK